MNLIFTKKYYKEFTTRVPAINIYYNLEELSDSEELMFRTLEQMCELNKVKIQVWWYKMNLITDRHIHMSGLLKTIYYIPDSFNMAKVIVIIFNYLKNARVTTYTINKN